MAKPLGTSISKPATAHIEMLYVPHSRHEATISYVCPDEFQFHIVLTLPQHVLESLSLGI